MECSREVHEFEIFGGLYICLFNPLRTPWQLNRHWLVNSLFTRQTDILHMYMADILYIYIYIYTVYIRMYMYMFVCL